jgi:hypothetical protein
VSTSGTAAAPSSRDLINADLGLSNGSGSVTTEAPAVSEEVSNEINAIPDESEVAIGEQEQEAPGIEEPGQEGITDNIDEKPDIPNLNETRWKTVHAGYKYAQEIGRALGLVGEDGRVDINMFPPAQEVQAMREAYSDRIAMEHDFASGDPQNAEQWVQNWHAFSPQGMGMVAAVMPRFLAQNQPQAYQAMATPVLHSFLDYMYQMGAQQEDPQVRDYILNGARAAEWWLKGGPTGGTYRSDQEILKPQQPQPSPVERELAYSRQQLAQIQQRSQQAQWTHFADSVNGQIGQQMDASIGQALAPLQAFYPNPVSFDAVRNEFIGRLQQQLRSDDFGRRQFAIAMERAQRTRSQEDQEALVSHYMTMARRAVNAVRGKFISEASQGIAQNSAARHKQLAAAASKVGPTSAGTPHRQSIVTKLERRPDETNSDFQRRMIARDLGIPG